jgi:hypothetical protein
MKVMLKLSFLSCCLLPMFCLSSAYAIPPMAGTALYADPFRMEEYSGFAYVGKTEGTNTLHCEIDYAVFDLRHEEKPYNGVDPSRGQDRYLYAYQIFSTSSNIDLRRFAVDIPQGVTANHIAYDWDKGILGGIPSSQQRFVEGSAVWQFGDPGNPPITAATNSLVLIFTSKFAPGQSEAEFTAIGIDGYVGASVSAPVLTPEPATLALLGIGAATVLRKRSRA